MKRNIALLGSFAILVVLLAACSTPTPEVIIETVEVNVPGDTIVETVEVPVEAEPVDKVVVEFWSTDNEEPRVDTYEALAAAFMAENPGIEVRIIPIE